MFTSIILTAALAMAEPGNPIQPDPQVETYLELINKKPCNNKAIEELLIQILEKYKADETVIKRLILQEGQCISSDVVLAAAIAVGIDPALLGKFIGPTGSGSNIGTSSIRPAPPPMSMSGGGNGSGSKDNASVN